MSFSVKSASHQTYKIDVQAKDARGYRVVVDGPKGKETLEGVKDAEDLKQILAQKYDVKSELPSQPMALPPSTKQVGGVSFSTPTKATGEPPKEPTRQEILRAAQRLDIAISDPPSDSDKARVKVATAEAQRYMEMNGADLGAHGKDGRWGPDTDKAYVQYKQKFPAAMGNPDEALKLQARDAIAERPLGKAQPVDVPATASPELKALHEDYVGLRADLVAHRERALNEGDYSLANHYGMYIDDLDDNVGYAGKEASKDNMTGLRSAMCTGYHLQGHSAERSREMTRGEVIEGFPFGRPEHIAKDYERPL